MTLIFQDSRTGARVRQVGGSGGEDEAILVQGENGPPYYVSRAKLMPCDDQGNPDRSTTAADTAAAEKDDVAPEPKIPLIETRLNLNAATPEEIARRIPGITYRTAKRIKENQLTQPGERFRSIDQVKAIAPRVNWEAVEQANVFFLG